MRIRSLRLLSFRAHAETRVTIAPGVNLFYGPNGAGKTNLLEAIHYLCLSKSFLASSDQYVLKKGCPYFEVEGHFEGVRRADLRVRLVYVPDEGKRIFVNGAPLERLSDLVGQLPVVAFSPEDQALTAGSPEERRRFLNNILSQARPVYLDDLMKYRRALRQRNELLSQARRRRQPVAKELLEPWDAELVALGSRVTAGRHRFVRLFSDYVDRAYQHMEQVAERPTLAYQAFAALGEADDEAAVAQKYERKLAAAASRERERGVTLVGPHRDELVFRLNGLEVRRYASQGQHRTFGMALKLAKYFYLQEQLDEPPMLLLDDVFDHLDKRRTETLLWLLEGSVVGQSLITDTERAPFDEVVDFDRIGHRAVRVEGGRVLEEARAEEERERGM